MKKIFENAVWWSGVVMVGLILGISLQFVRAWTEPADAPPNGNVGAPINTGANLQTKGGSLALLGQLITSYINIPGSMPAAGSVLTAQNAAGQVAWAPSGGGGCFGAIQSLPDPGEENYSKDPISADGFITVQCAGGFSGGGSWSSGAAGLYINHTNSGSPYMGNFSGSISIMSLACATLPIKKGDYWKYRLGGDCGYARISFFPLECK